VSIGDIAERFPGVPRTSACRHLTGLEAAGIVRRVTASDEFTRFELAEDLAGHHHLLFLSCGKVIDVTLPDGLAAPCARRRGCRTVSAGTEELCDGSDLGEAMRPAHACCPFLQPRAPPQSGRIAGTPGDGGAPW
jgi:hypothetical protein